MQCGIGLMGQCTLSVAVFLVAETLLTLCASMLLLTVLNLFCGVVAQVIPAMLGVFFMRQLRPVAVALGMAVA